MLKKMAFSALLMLLAACGGESKTASNQSAQASNEVNLLNVSYDVSRDFYKDYNELFHKKYNHINIQQSHGGSSKQALQVANGLQADVVTMNQSADIEMLQKKGLVAKDWQQAFPNQAVPYTTTTVMLVRKGNPKAIKDWVDLANAGVQLVLPNPKTSGNGRYVFLAVYGDALKRLNGNHQAAHEFMRQFYANAVVLETGARGATTTFVQRQLGDVLVTAVNEAHIAIKQNGANQFEMVYPQYSIAADNPVAVVQTVTSKKGNSEPAKLYLDYLWSKEAQQLAAELYLRPTDAEVLAKYSERFPKIELFRANDVLGSWDDIMKTYFADGGVFDQIYQKK